MAKVNTKAKQTESNFGDETPATTKRTYKRRAPATTAATKTPSKRTYKRKAQTSDVAMVTISVPASMAFKIGMALGREIRT